MENQDGDYNLGLERVSCDFSLNQKMEVWSTSWQMAERM